MFKTLSRFWDKIQGSLFPELEEELGPLTKMQQQLISTLEIIRIEQYLPQYFGCVDRPQKHRSAIARAFVTKAVYNMPTTRMLIDRLQSDISLRRICGWENRNRIPDKATFSREFAEFATSELLKLVHNTLISKAYEKQLIWHISRDSTLLRGVKSPYSRRKRRKNPKNVDVPKKERNAPKSLSDWTNN